MRIFWSFIALLMAAGVVIGVIAARTGGPSSTRQPDSGATGARDASPSPAPARSPTESPSRTATIVDDPAESATDADRAREPAEPAPITQPPIAEAAPNPGPEPSPTPPDAPAGASLIAITVPYAVGRSPTDDGIALGGGAVPGPTDLETAPAAATPTLEPRDDGSTLVDGRFIVRGEGTRESPYVVSWELLISAEEIYVPRLGKNDLPGRVTMLRDKHVSITGNVLLPFYEPEPRELLLMMNEWDGCCIGVPPTPYDAIEVRLASPLAPEKRTAATARVTGVLRVEPYLSGSWLVGLYVLDGATIEPTGWTGRLP